MDSWRSEAQASTSLTVGEPVARKLRAYLVQWEQQVLVLFAPNPHQARALARSIWKPPQGTLLATTRRQDLDRYSTTTVPAKVILDDLGMSLGCGCCGLLVNSHFPYEVVEPNLVFCSACCQQQFVERQSIFESNVQAFARGFQKYLPCSKIEHKWVDAEGVRHLQFSIPGAIAPLTYDEQTLKLRGNHSDVVLAHEYVNHSRYLN